MNKLHQDADIIRDIIDDLWGIVEDLEQADKEKEQKLPENERKAVHDAAYKEGFEKGKKQGFDSGKQMGKILATKIAFWRPTLDGKFTCEECHETAEKKTRYCPSCGAAMLGYDKSKNEEPKADTMQNPEDKTKDDIKDDTTKEQRRIWKFEFPKSESESKSEQETNLTDEEKKKLFEKGASDLCALAFLSFLLGDDK